MLLLLCGRGEGARHVGGVGGGWFEAHRANPHSNPNPNPNPLTFALVAQVEEAVARLEDGLGQLEGRALVQPSEEEEGDADDVDHPGDEGEGEELPVLLVGG